MKEQRVTTTMNDDGKDTVTLSTNDFSLFCSESKIGGRYGQVRSFAKHDVVHE